MQRGKKPLAAQLKQHANEIAKPSKSDKAGNTEIMVSTGSLLLDLAISGKRKRGGGIPGGILLEAFGPEGSGKTVLLCEIGGAIQRQGGDILFNDPEARLNKKFAQLFDLDTAKLTVNEPDTVTEVFAGIRNWEPKTSAKVHGIMTDSLAALSTNMEMESEEGDKMGMRRAKEFSEGFRRVTRILKQNNYIMACSNQIREKADVVGYGEKFTVPGGKAIAFYASIRLRFMKPEKVKKKRIVKGKEVTKVIGTKVVVEVYKNSVDEPYRTAELYIIFDYGVDDIRANLQYIKEFKKTSVYTVNGKPLSKSLEDSIEIVESEKLEGELENEVIELWEEIENGFNQERTKKRR